MLFFDGFKRGCIKFSKAKGGVLRCSKFKKGNRKPVCPGQGLKGGGRSQYYIRGGVKKCSTRTKSIGR